MSRIRIAPILRRKIVEPLWGLKSGSPLFAYWKELEKTQFLTEDDLKKRQWVKLKQIIEFVYLHNNYYHKRFDELGIKPEDVKSPADVNKLPILTKKDVRENEMDIISNGFKQAGLMEAKTGGSTGKSLKLYFTEECSELRNACARRHDRWSGWEVGEPIGAIWGNPVLPKNLKSKLRDRLLQPVIYLDTMQVSERSVVDFAKQWQQTKPTLIFGHAHSIFILAEYLKKLDINTVKPKGIISSSMMLLPHERDLIEEVFMLRVFDRYGCEEVSLIASECEKHEGMHLNIEHLYIEFLKDDGTYAKPGEQGKIVVTDLMNKAMPFIRYNIEDIGVHIDKKCSCGRGLPLMEKVIGRVADFLIKKDGIKVAGVSLIERTLTAIKGIQQMQIVQEELNNMNLNIVKGNEYNHNSENLLLEEFKHVFGRDVNISLKYLDNIPPEPSGKYRFSICKVKSIYSSSK